ncbi:hypothetical protein ACFUMI_24675, partial [Streptomyces sp. NPDC057273]|uniref:hypothetical protein n=1 Tax=unclassified Streptomyces TaxID=2593676 RepID=UPI00362A86F8
PRRSPAGRPPAPAPPTSRARADGTLRSRTAATRTRTDGTRHGRKAPHTPQHLTRRMHCT